MFSEGQQVRVIDSECSLHNQVVTIIGPHPRCTAEWVVWDEKDKPWVVHSCRLREVGDDLSEAHRAIACDIDTTCGLLRDLQERLITIGDKAEDLGLDGTESDTVYAGRRIGEAIDALYHRTSLPLG